MFSFAAAHVRGSWQASGSTATLRVDVTAALRDNSPGGDAPPDDPFVADVEVQAICIWTFQTAGLIGRFDRLFGGLPLGR